MMVVDEDLALITGCRSCTGTHLQSVLSLGETPLANSLLDSEEAASQIRRFPLDMVRCLQCHLVQLRQVVSPERLLISREVGMVVAQLGLSMGVIAHNIYSVIVLMSVATTLVAPPLLKLAYKDLIHAAQPEEEMYRLG